MSDFFPSIAQKLPKAPHSPHFSSWTPGSLRMAIACVTNIHLHATLRPADCVSGSPVTLYFSLSLQQVINNDFEPDTTTCPHHLLLNSFPIKSSSIISLTTSPRASSNAAVPCAPSLSILGTFFHAQVLAAFTNRPPRHRVEGDQPRRQAVHRPARARAGREGLHPGIPEERRARATSRRRARGSARPRRRPCRPRTSATQNG